MTSAHDVASRLRLARDELKRGRPEQAQAIVRDVEALWDDAAGEAEAAVEADVAVAVAAPAAALAGASGARGAALQRRADVAHLLASYHRDSGALEECERFARAAIDAQRTAGGGILLGNHLMFLSLLLEKTNRPRAALAAAEEAVPLYARSLGNDHNELRYLRSVVARLTRLLANARPQ